MVCCSNSDREKCFDTGIYFLKKIVLKQVKFIQIVVGGILQKENEETHADRFQRYIREAIREAKVEQYETSTSYHYYRNGNWTLDISIEEEKEPNV